MYSCYDFTGCCSSGNLIWYGSLLIHWLPSHTLTRTCNVHQIWDLCHSYCMLYLLSHHRQSPSYALWYPHCMTCQSKSHPVWTITEHVCLIKCCKEHKHKQSETFHRKLSPMCHGEALRYPKFEGQTTSQMHKIEKDPATIQDHVGIYDG